MNKRILSCLAAALMIAALLVTTPAAGASLASKSVTLTVTPRQSAVSAADKDVYVTFDITLASDDGVTPIPAFSFNLKADEGLVLATMNKGDAAKTATPDYYWWVNTAELSSKENGDGEYKAPYNVFSYTPSPNQFFGGAGTAAGAGITTEKTVMTIAVKIPAGTPSGSYTLTAENLIAGSGSTYENIAEQFGARTVVPGTVTVLPCDLTTLARHVAGIQPITDTALKTAADLDGDTKVTANDLTMLARLCC